MSSKSFKPKRKIRPSINVPTQTRKLYENISRIIGKPITRIIGKPITHVIGKPIFNAKTSRLMRSYNPKPISYKRNWRLDESPVIRTLGICMMCHGNIGYSKMHPIVDVPLGVTIHKKNIGSFGKCSYGLFKAKDYARYNPVSISKWQGSAVAPLKDISVAIQAYVADETLSTLTNFDKCVDKQRYDAFISAYSEPESSCDFFEGQQFYSKMYSFKPFENKTITFNNNYIMFIYSPSPGIFKRVNLVTCTQEELDDFFGTTSSVTSDFIKLKEERINGPVKRLKLTTENIFTLIEHARDTLQVADVNILDLSCNLYSGNLVRDPRIGY